MELNGFDHLMFFIVGILIPGLSLLSSRSTAEVEIEPILPEKKHIYFSNGLLLWIGALLVVTNWNLTDRSWELLGIRFPLLNTFTWVMCGLLLGIYFFDSLFGIIKAKREDSGADDHMEKILPSNWREYLSFIFLAVSAGICEEFIFRGFLVNYFFELTKSSSFAAYLAILIPAVIFSVSHIYQGWLNVVKIFSLALLFGGIFLFSQSLVLVIIIHVFVDLMSGAIVVVMAPKHK